MERVHQWKFERRAYEARAVATLRSSLPAHRRVLAVGPTGCGKTVIASMLIKSEPTWRVLFVAHRYEIIDQAHTRLVANGITAGVMMATEERLHGTARLLPDARVQVASVQTATRRGVVGRFDLIVFDEAHRTMADSYQRIAEAHPNAMFLGLTATPIRLDGRGLGDFYAHLYEIAKPSDLYARGYLAKPRVYGAPMDALVELRKRMRGETASGGDYSGAALARIVASEMLVGKVVEETLRIAPHVPKVVFAGSVKHSQTLAQKFRRRGVKAVHLDGETDLDTRERILEDLRAGKIEVVCNVDVLSEGWDLPALGAVVLARPTNSIARLLQMAGRVQRPYKDRVPLILDHGNSVIDLGVLPGSDIGWSLDRTVKREKGDPILKICGDCQEVIPSGCTECPSCGALQPRTAMQEREEAEAKLVEITQAKLEEIRARVERVAREKKAPNGWVEKVMAEMGA